MKEFLAMMAVLIAATPLVASASPESDQQLYRKYFEQKFPGVPLQEYSNGVYAIDDVSRANWEAIEEFPPYEPMIDDGKAMWNKPFANGKSYKDCFGKPSVVADYPYWDKKKGMVWTLPLAINECLTKNGEKPLGYGKGKIAALLAYMGYESRGQVTDVKIPKDEIGRAHV